MNAPVNFTKSWIENLPTPASSRITYKDSKIRAFQLIVTKTGNKSFFVRKKINGRSERFLIGKYPDVSVEKARALAQTTLGTLAAGKTPEEIRRPSTRATFLGDAFLVYLERHAKDHKRSWKEDQAQFNRYLTKWQSRPLKTLTRNDISKLHTEIGKDHGHYAANRVLALLSKLFNFLKSIDLYSGDNPTSGIKRFKEQARQRYIGPDELPAFVAALGQEQNETARDFFWLALLTAQRMSNVLCMRWDDLDMNRLEWRIAMTKNGTPMTVPLLPQVVEIIEKRNEHRQPDEVYVLAGSGKTGRMTQPKKAWERIISAAGIEDLRIHDLRHTMASWQAYTGASLPVIGRTLNHKTAAATSRYAHVHLNPVRQSMAIAAEGMFAAARNSANATT